MEWLGGWLTGVTAAAILCALAERLMPEGAVRRVGKLALGLVMLFAMVRPLVQIPVESPADLFSEYQAQTAAQAQELEQGRDEAMKAIIEQEFAAYIVDKADQMGVVCTARVACQAGEDGVFLPQSAQVVGNFSPQQRETLAQMLEGELGLPRDRQTIQTKEESP